MEESKVKKIYEILNNIPVTSENISVIEEIKEEILKFFEQNKSETLVFVGIPLLFESNMSNLFDKSLLIYTNDTLREERLISRNHYSGDYAKLRMKSQMSQDKKLKLCDFVIYNNGTLSDLKSAVNEFLLKI